MGPYDTVQVKYRYGSSAAATKAKANNAKAPRTKDRKEGVLIAFTELSRRDLRALRF